MASAFVAGAGAPIVMRVTGGTRGVDRSSAPSASASSSVDRMLDASLPPAFTGSDTFRAVLDWHLRSVPGDRNLVWRIGSRVLGADVPLEGRLADWVRVLGGSPLVITISPGSDSNEEEAIKYAFACHLAGLPWPLWDADERDPINRRLLGVGPNDPTAAPRLDEDNRISNLVGLRHGRHVKFVNVHALADAMKRGNTVEPVFRTDVSASMDDFVRCIQAAVHTSIHSRADDPAVGLLPIIELATMVVDQRYGRAFAANSRRAAASALSVPAPASATRAPTLSPAAQQWEEEEKERKKKASAAEAVVNLRRPSVVAAMVAAHRDQHPAAAAPAAASPPLPRQPDEEKQRADVMAKFTSQVQVYLRTTPDVTLSRAFHYYAENNSLEWDPLSVDEREALVRAAFNRSLEEKKRKEAVLANLTDWVRAHLRNNPDATLMRIQVVTRDARNLRVAGELVPIPELEKLVYDEFTRHTEERKVAAMLRVGDEAQLAGAVSAAAAALSESKKKKKKKKDDEAAAAGGGASGVNSPDDLAKIKQVVDAMESEARRVGRYEDGDSADHMKAVKKAAVAMLDGAGLRTTEAKRELRLRLDRLQEDAAWQARMANMQAREAWEGGGGADKHAAAIAAEAAAAASRPAPAANISADERRGIEYDIRSFVGLLQRAPKTTLVEAEQVTLFNRRALSADAKKEQMRQALESYRRHVQSPAAAGNPRRSIVVLFRAAQKKAYHAEDGSAYWSRESELMIELGRSPPVEQRAYIRMRNVVQEIETRVRMGDLAKDRARAAIANAVLVDYADKAVDGAAFNAMKTADRMLLDDHDAIIRRIADEVTPDIKRAMFTVDGLSAVNKQAIESLKRAGVHTPDAIRALKERMRKIHHQLARGDKVMWRGGVLDAPPIPASSSSAAAAVAMDADDGDDHDDDDDGALSARLVEAKMRKKLDKIRADGQELTVFDINGPVHALLRREGVTDQAVVNGLVARLTKEYIGRAAAPPAASSAAASSAAANHLASRMQQMRW